MWNEIYKSATQYLCRPTSENVYAASASDLSCERTSVNVESVVKGIIKTHLNHKHPQRCRQYAASLANLLGVLPDLDRDAGARNSLETRLAERHVEYCLALAFTYDNDTLLLLQVTCRCDHLGRWPGRVHDGQPSCSHVSPLASILALVDANLHVCHSSRRSLGRIYRDWCAGARGSCE